MSNGRSIAATGLILWLSVLTLVSSYGWYQERENNEDTKTAPAEAVYCTEPEVTHDGDATASSTACIKCPLEAVTTQGNNATYEFKCEGHGLITMEE